MKKLQSLFPVLLSSLICIGTTTALEARTWTDAATGRTLEGDFVRVDGKKVVISRNNGETAGVLIDRLVEADKEFIRAQLSEPARENAGRSDEEAPIQKEEAPASGPLTRLTPPVSLVTHSIEGEGKERKAKLELRNESGKEILEFAVEVFYLKQDGSTGRHVPHTEAFFNNDPEGVIAKGETHVFNVNSIFMEDDTASLDGFVSSIEWKDGSNWPTWNGPAPKQEGNNPVVAEMIGIIGEGENAQPVVAVFNTGTKDISALGYSIGYLDADGKNLGWCNHIYSGPEGWLPTGKGGACVGGTKSPPEGTVDVELTLSTVVFSDETHWRPDEK